MQRVGTWFYVRGLVKAQGQEASYSLHLARVDTCNSLPKPIISSQLMSRLTPTLLRSVLHLQAVALLLVKVTEVRNWLGVLGSGGGRRVHSSSYGRFWCSGCRVVALLQAVCGVGEGGQRVEGR